MSNNRQPRPIPIIEGYQPKAGTSEPLGYQPGGKSALDPRILKPPKNWDTAVQPPKVESDKKAS